MVWPNLNLDNFEVSCHDYYFYSILAGIAHRKMLIQSTSLLLVVSLVFFCGVVVQCDDDSSCELRVRLRLSNCLEGYHHPSPGTGIQDNCSALENLEWKLQECKKKLDFVYCQDVGEDVINTFTYLTNVELDNCRRIKINAGN